LSPALLNLELKIELKKYCLLVFGLGHSRVFVCFSDGSLSTSAAPMMQIKQVRLIIAAFMALDLNVFNFYINLVK